jgi:endonuclease III
MSRLTVELMRRAPGNGRSRRWPRTFALIADRLVAAYGVPALGNFLDPVKEIFYIVLSARTTDAQYRKTHRALRKAFPTLGELATAPVEDIVPCIVGGGLANKRASQVRRLAAELLKLGGNPGKRLKEMSAQEVYDFLIDLPGMGPKSALCVMMFSLGHDAFPADANVQRVASRLGAIPAGLKHYQAQQRLPALVPDGRSKELHIGLVVHGRTTCLPRKPRCEECLLADLCGFGRERLKTGRGKKRVQHQG